MNKLIHFSLLFIIHAIHNTIYRLTIFVHYTHNGYKRLVH